MLNLNVKTNAQTTTPVAAVTVDVALDDVIGLIAPQETSTKNVTFTFDAPELDVTDWMEYY